MNIERVLLYAFATLGIAYMAMTLQAAWLSESALTMTDLKLALRGAAPPALLVALVAATQEWRRRKKQAAR